MIWKKIRKLLKVFCDKEYGKKRDRRSPKDTEDDFTLCAVDGGGYDCTGAVMVHIKKEEIHLIFSKWDSKKSWVEYDRVELIPKEK